jgi:hypothetical protein
MGAAPKAMKLDTFQVAGWGKTSVKAPHEALSGAFIIKSGMMPINESE